MQRGVLNRSGMTSGVEGYPHVSRRRFRARLNTLWRNSILDAAGSNPNNPRLIVAADSRVLQERHRRSLAPIALCDRNPLCTGHSPLHGTNLALPIPDRRLPGE